MVIGIAHQQEHKDDLLDVDGAETIGDQLQEQNGGIGEDVHGIQLFQSSEQILREGDGMALDSALIACGKQETAENVKHTVAKLTAENGDECHSGNTGKQGGDQHGVVDCDEQDK